MNRIQYWYIQFLKKNLIKNRARINIIKKVIDRDEAELVEKMEKWIKR